MVASTATSLDPGHQVAWVAFGEQTYWVAHGRRLTIGSAESNDIVLEGPGIAHKHARLSLPVDGRLLVKPVQGEPVRIDRARTKGSAAVAVQPGCTLGIGLVELHTGVADTNLAHHLMFVKDDAFRAAKHFASRAPWMLLSVLVHGLLLLLLVTMLDERHDGEGGRRQLTLKTRQDADADVTDDADEPQEDLAVREPQLPEVELQDSSADSQFEAAASESEDDPGIGASGDLSSMLEGVVGQDIGRTRTRKLPQNVSRKFKRTVAKLRRSGLEVALAFDSTASMGRLLTDAKRDLRTIFMLLQELVPAARVSLITYRDHGDDYVTRQTPLGTSHYEALAFLSAVRADGGGDFEEAIDEALKTARRLAWSSSALKIVVICGDAPPHKEKLRSCQSHAKWIKGRKGQVHCLSVGNDQETRRAFERISKAGGGRTIPREDSHRLALQLLSFAFGQGSEKDLNAMLVEQIAKQRHRFGKRRSTTLPSPQMLTTTLTRAEPDPVIVEAWTWAKPPELGALTGKLSGQRLSREGVHALYYVVNRALERQAGWLEPIHPVVGQRKTQSVPQTILKQLQRWRHQ